MEIAAQYGDGRSARRHPVVLHLEHGRLAVTGADVEASYRLADVRLAEPFANAASVAYFPDGAHCEVHGADRAALEAMLGHRPTLAVRWQRRWPVALASIVLLAGVVGAGAVWGVPFAADLVTPLIPVSVDSSIGASTRQTLVEHKFVMPSTLSGEQRADIQRIWDSVQPAHPRMVMAIMVRAMPDGFGPNALALPDGTVVLNDAMVRLVLADDKGRFSASEAAALAGVLAHEIGHVEGRHSMRALVGGSMTAALTAYMFGDFSAVAAGAPAVLLGARHSRAMESQADAYAMRALAARGLPLTPLADLFDRMSRWKQRDADAGKQKADDDDAENSWWHVASGFLASHPGSKQRAALLRAARPATP